MKWTEFRQKFHVRACEKCCESCKHGHIDERDTNLCEHPELDEGEGFATCLSDVCDKWEGFK